MPAPTILEKLAEFFEAHPDARISSSEGAELFGCTQRTLRQEVYELRRRGLQVRSVRVFMRRQREGRAARELQAHDKEALQWHDAAACKPDSDTTVLGWIVEGIGQPGEWSRVWWDAERERWMDAATNAPVAGLVTHWSEPAGPGAWMDNAQGKGPIR